MIELKSETQQMVDKANASIISEQRERIAELEKLVVMAYEMDTDSYADIYNVKWLANRLVKEQYDEL